MRTVLFVACVVCGMFLQGCAVTSSGRQSTRTGLFFRSLTLNGVEHKYAYFVPRSYTTDRGWACVIFLNGSGECGTDGQRQLTQGLFPAMLAEPRDWPMIAIFPQKPDRASLWADHDQLVLATLEATTREVRIDERRVYLTGLSQGGAGTWAIAARHPGRFAAIAPVCGFGDPSVVGSALDGMPIWALHGVKDDVVPIAHSQRLVEAVAASSGRTVVLDPPPGSSLRPEDRGDLRFTRFPDLNHGCWDRAYRDMELGEWMLSFSRK